MNYEQIVANAQSRYGVSDRESIRISVAAQPGNPARESTFALFDDWAKKNGGKPYVVAAGSFGLYDLEPIVVVQRTARPAVLCRCGSVESANRLIREVAEDEDLASGLVLGTIGDGKAKEIPSAEELSLFGLQKRFALRNCGLVDPEDINDYIICCDGYRGLWKALQMGRDTVIKEVKESRLRGRGGAGYPTADKWIAIGQAEKGARCLVCNAIDGDPISRTASLLLESDPHAVLEGLLVGAHAIGATQAIICVATGSDHTIRILRKALEQMAFYGLVGVDILDSGFECSIEVREVERSLVAGEETALLRSLAGRQAMPYLRGNQPLVKGFESRPTVVNNIETLANVSAILAKGARWFSATGTEASAGSKVMTLSGMVLHRYTVEVPFGTKLGSVVTEIGGVPEGKTIKAVQFGGPTGRYIDPAEFDVAIGFETLETPDSIMGSGSIEIIDGGTCAVEMTERVMSYVHSQSCGKCVFCREGTFQISDILKDITEGEGKQQDLDLLTELAEEMRIGTICGLGRSAANPVLSSLRLFGSEYEAHIREKKCPKAQ
jgi:NADH:ubiquinone oxidoreductase subunit F (NADH-binding)